MENNIPSYLTREVLKNALENGFKTSGIQIEDFTVSLASGKGENYTSEIHRINVNYKESEQNSQQIFLIVKKLLLPAVEVNGVLKRKHILQIEIDMYTKVIPEIEKLFGTSTTFAPKCFEVNNEKQTIVLSDLKPMGYELQNRLVGLDEPHCAIVMKKIAQFHAGSMVIAKTNTKYADIFNHPSLFNEYNITSDFFIKFCLLNFERMINVARSWPEYKNIVLKLEKICSNLMDKGFEHCKRKEKELRVINHGDLWVNNIMFKYNDGDNAPSDAAFVDLQLSYYGSLGIDINYFFNTSPQLGVLKSKRTELLKTYYNSLKSTLEQFKYSPIPSWEEVSKEVRAKEFYGLIALGCVFPITSMDKTASENNTMKTMLDDSQQKTDAMYGSERMRETLKYSLKRFDELGVLDE